MCWAQILQEFDLQLHYQKDKYNIVADALIHMPMANEVSITKFKSSLLESLKGLCEHDIIFVKVWQIVHAQNKTMKLSPPSLEMRVSLVILSELLMRREASFDPEQSNEVFGCRAEVVDSKVDPSSSFVLDPLDNAKLC